MDGNIDQKKSYYYYLILLSKILLIIKQPGESIKTEEDYYNLLVGDDTILNLTSTLR